MTAAQDADFNDPQRGEFQPGAIGRLLRETREGYRQDIATVSQQLRIRSVYLKAIEDGNYQDLPGSAYAVGFVRTYAEYLGLDPQEIVRRFRDEADEVNRRTRLVFPVPTVEAKVPSGALILVALIVAALAYGGWYYLSDRDRSLVDLVPALPDSLRGLVDPSDETDPADSQAAESQVDETPVPNVAAASESEPADAVAQDDVAQDGVALGDTAQDAQEMSAATLSEPLLPVEESAGTDPAPDATSVGSTAESETAGDTAVATTDPAADAAATTAELSSAPEVSTASVEPDATEPDTSEAATIEPATPAAATTEPATGALAPLPEVEVAAIPEAPRVPSSVQDGQSFGVAFGGSRVVIVARMESWLQVSDADGNAIWARVLRAGDRYLVPEQEGLVLSVGNAGGIDVFVDGSKAPSLGAVGVGRRGISLDPDRLRSGTALP